MPEIAVIVPVLNEKANIVPMAERLDRVLTGIDWELIYVDDDSPDGTADAARALSRRDPRVRVLQRIGRRGLASAAVEGMMASAAPWVAVMDGDMQHDEAILPEMLRQAREGGKEIVVGSRNVAGGSMGEFAADRVRLSNLGKSLSRLITQNHVSDPMSGYFLVSRALLDEVSRDLSQIGFKILLDILASARRPLRMAEVGYTFRNREHGESKLDPNVSFDYLLLIADKLIGHWVPVRYALYSAVGLCGVFIHFLVLALLGLFSGPGLLTAQAIATYVSMAGNFLLNNSITYRDRKLRGSFSLIRGLIIYAIGCSLGVVANLGATKLLAEGGLHPWLAAAVGVVLSSVWNYGVATLFTWKVLQHRRDFARSKREQSRLSQAG
jgi:dolichol-phosphate mannosyltransferase